MSEQDIQATIDNHVKSNRIFLYMKGTPEAPACGFSHEVVQALKQLNVSFESFNVLESWDVRQGIKEYAKWPFIPQLYVDSKFIGGRDIVMKMHRAGELQPLVNPTN